MSFVWQCLKLDGLATRGLACACFYCESARVVDSSTDILLTEERHDGGAGVVGVLPRNKGGHHKPGHKRLQLVRAN